MTETRAVGTATASISDNTTALMTAMNTAMTQDTRIVLGANAKFKAAWFRMNHTNFPMTIIAADRNNPPIQTEGWCLTGQDNEGFFGNRSGPFASSVQDITFDGIHHVPRKLTHIAASANGDFGDYTIQDMPGGIAWRIDSTFEGYDSSGKNNGYGAGAAYMKAFAGFNGAQNITVQNCYFDGYGRAITAGGANGFLFRHNTWQRWHEDCFWISGGSGIVIEYNLFDHGRAITRRDAFLGWSYGTGVTGLPPHTDACQTFRPTQGFTFQFNVMYDEDRSHFCLHQMNDAGGKHTGTRIRNNYSEQYDNTTIWVGDCTAPLVETNKFIKAGGSEGVIFRVGAVNNAGAIVRNNYAPSQQTNDGNLGNWAVNSNNKQTNSLTDMPPGWVEIRKNHPDLPSGARYAGQYGNSGPDPQTAPSFSTTPSLSPADEVEAGEDIDATQAAVSGNPTPTRTHQWRRNGTLDTNITGTTYTTVTGDIDDVFTYRTVANNGIGGNASHNVFSNFSDPVTVIEPVVVPPDTAPVFTTVPAINPVSVVVGGVLTATQAVVTGNPTPTKTNRWYRNGVLITGQTGLTYTTQAVDVGLPITYKTHANNTTNGSTVNNVDSSASNAVTVLTNAAPAGLTAGQVVYVALVEDAAFPGPRRTFTISVPASSPAANADAMFWSSDADASIRPMTQQADEGGAEIWRARSSVITATAHLRNPGASFTNVKLYYRVTASSLQSSPSTYTFSATVPAAPFGTDTKRIDTTTLSRCRFGGHEGIALRINGVTYWGASASFAATGGTVTTSGGYKYHTFTSSGTFTVTEGSRTDAEMLLIGGGGSGGEFRAGGGGAGRVRVLPGLSLSPQAYTITVGNGGASVSSGGGGNYGTASTALGFTSVPGGGGGGSDGPVGKPGGGGGSGGPIGGTNAAGAANAGGFAGGAGFLSADNSERRGGGGGGASSAGVAGTALKAGNGGAGITLSWPTAVVYASGGGGGTSDSVGWGQGWGSYGDGGAAGLPPTAGLTPGSGGGGSGPDGQASGAGVKGIVIIRYPV
jgi:hypothetical protein